MAWREIYNQKKPAGIPVTRIWNSYPVILTISWQIFVLISVHQKHLQEEHLFWLFTFKYIFNAWKEITFYHLLFKKKKHANARGNFA